ncbi:MAG: DUF6159 family protein [Thermoplasmatota archaeon]
MNFTERMSNSWVITKACFRVLWRNPKLLEFPLISMIASLWILAGFTGLIFFAPEISGEGSSLVVVIPASVMMYYLVVLVTIFCNVAIVGSAGMMLEGRSPSLGDGLRFAWSRIWHIIGWTLITATVTFILQMIQSRSGALGRIVIGIIGFAWTVLTYFVVPVLVFEGVGPIKAIRRSKDILRRTWGESLIANFSIGMITGLFMLAFILLIGPVCIYLISLGAVVLALYLGIVLILALVLVALINTALKGILMASLYKYSVTGRPGFGMPEHAVRHLFSSR